MNRPAIFPAMFDDVIRPDAVLRHIADQKWASLPSEGESGAYDRIAGAYDAIIANRRFSPTIWGCPANAFEDAVRAALALRSNGYVLDAPCGSMAFSTRAYGSVDLERTVLFDRSLGMIRRASKRQPTGTFLHGDIYASPFRDNAFETVMSWGLFHVVGTTPSLVSSFCRIMQPGASFSMYTLVLANRRVGDQALQTLHRIGHAASPETAEQVCEIIGEQLEIEQFTLRGNMLFLTARRE